MEKEITIHQLLQILWNGRFLILAITLVMVLLGCFYGFGIYTPVYRSSCFIDVSPYYGTGDRSKPQQLVETGRMLMQEKDFWGIKSGMPEEVLDTVRLETVPNTFLLKVQVSSPELEIAQQTVKIAGEKLLEWANQERQKELERRAIVLRNALAGIDTELETLEEDLYAGAKEYPENFYPNQTLLEARAEVAAELHTVSANLEQLANGPQLDPGNFVYPGEASGGNFLVQRVMYPAAALILGLVMSCLLVFLRYLWRTADNDAISSP